MSKVIRLTEADLTRIVRRVIEEQSTTKVNPMNAPGSRPTNTTGTTPKPTNNVNNIVFKGKTVNLYNDALNTKLYRQITILDEPKDNGGVVSIKLASDQQMSYDCTKPQQFKIVEPASVKPLSYNVFNNRLASQFNSKFCQKNPMGKTVPKADYASVGSQSGSNIA